MAFFAIAAAAAAFLVAPVRAWLALPAGSSGWLVLATLPFFAWQRWRERPDYQSAPEKPWMVWAALPLGGIVALTRVVLEPFPAWPMAEWIYAAALAALSLTLIWVWLGPACVRRGSFLVVFTAAGLPWPAVIETGLVSRWRELLASGVAECCESLGKPAVAQGTLIRLGHATMGIEEACGGIRSLQLAVILGLAIGDFRRDDRRGRIRWIGGAIGLALACNGLRLFGLTWICACFGQAQSERWHDPMDWAELGGWLISLGTLAVMVRWPAAKPDLLPGEARMAVPPPTRTAVGVASILLVALIGSEGFTQVWFSPRAAEANRLAWAAHLPHERPSYAESAFTATMQQLLGCQWHEFGRWTNAMGQVRAGYILEWDQGQTARFAVLHHNPAICLPMAGNQVVATHRPAVLRAGSVDLPFACTEFRDRQGSYFVYYLVWNLTTGRPFGAAAEAPGAGESWLRMQWKEVAGRRRDLAIRVVTLAIFGAPNQAEADREFQSEAREIVSRSSDRTYLVRS